MQNVPTATATATGCGRAVAAVAGVRAAPLVAVTMAVGMSVLAVRIGAVQQLELAAALARVA